jgi:5-methylthioadenosine/S-adenosylhomocysteine deaminase
MKKADIILSNALVLTMDFSLNNYAPGAVAVCGDQIVGVGDEEVIRSQFTADEVIDCGGRVVMPGLINAHTHVPMALLRGLADDLRLDVWLQGYVWPVEKEFVSPDFVRTGTFLGCAELIRSGVTTFNDMYFFEDSIAEATAEIGLRAICGQTVLKFPTPDAASYEDAMANARAFIEKWKNHPLITPAIAPHAPYTTTPEILRETSELARQFDIPLHIHLAETSLEVENMRHETGVPVVPYVRKHGLLEAKVIAAHCVHIDMGEIRTLQNAGCGIAHNPSSNLKLASGFAPVTKMLAGGLNVGIGTDGAASNNDLDMFEEIRLAALLAKAVSNDPTSVPARTALLMATRFGAAALHIGHLTGALVPGLRADLIVVDISGLHNTPAFHRSSENIYSRIVYTTKASDVTDVMVNGRWLMRNRHLLTIDEPAILRQAEETAQRIDRFLIEREGSVLSKLIALGGSEEEESFEVQVKVKIAEPERIINRLMNSEADIVYERHYGEHDVYFVFEKETDGIIRYREDDFLENNGQPPTKTRTRLTLIGRKNYDQREQWLSRSRYLAPAANSLRFYREYFKPSREIAIEKDRLRWLIRYRESEFFVNLDHVMSPALGYFLEIKSRTWSRKDAENKATLLNEVLALFGESVGAMVSRDYLEIVEEFLENT